MFNVKNLFFAVVFLIISFSATATTVVINQSNSRSVMLGFTQQVQQYIPGQTRFYQSKNCKDSANVYNQLSNAVMPYELFNVGAASKANIDCAIEFTPGDVALYTTQAYKICKRTDSNLSLNDNRVRFGFPGPLPTGWVTELNSLNNLSIQTVVLPGAVAIQQALYSKDIDWGLLAESLAIPGIEQGLLSCEFTTRSNTTNFIGNYYDHSVPELLIEIVVLNKGNDTNEVRRELNNENFVRYLTQLGFSEPNFNFSDDDLLKYLNKQNILFEMY
jgi:hypothetical protein